MESVARWRIWPSHAAFFVAGVTVDLLVRDCSSARSRLPPTPRAIVEIGYSMANPIPDLKLDDRGFSGTLSFDRQPFLCKVPWAAVYALVGEDGRKMLYPEDVPPEVQAKIGDETLPQ